MKYLQRAVAVEAKQFFPNQLPWPKGVCGLQRNSGEIFCNDDAKADCWGVQGYGGWHLIKSGDWIVTDVFGQHRVYSARDFPLKFVPTSELVIEYSDGANIQPNKTDARKAVGFKGTPSRVKEKDDDGNQTVYVSNGD